MPVDVVFDFDSTLAALDMKKVLRGGDINFSGEANRKNWDKKSLKLFERLENPVKDFDAFYKNILLLDKADSFVTDVVFGGDFRLEKLKSFLWGLKGMTNLHIVTSGYVDEVYAALSSANLLESFKYIYGLQWRRDKQVVNSMVDVKTNKLINKAMAKKWEGTKDFVQYLHGKNKAIKEMVYVPGQVCKKLSAEYVTCVTTGLRGDGRLNIGEPEVQKIRQAVIENLRPETLKFVKQAVGNKKAEKVVPSTGQEVGASVRVYLDTPSSFARQKLPLVVHQQQEIYKTFTSWGELESSLYKRKLEETLSYRWAGSVCKRYDAVLAACSSSRKLDKWQVKYCQLIVHRWISGEEFVVGSTDYEIVRIWVGAENFENASKSYDIDKKRSPTIKSQPEIEKEKNRIFKEYLDDPRPFPEPESWE